MGLVLLPLCLQLCLFSLCSRRGSRRGSLGIDLGLIRRGSLGIDLGLIRRGSLGIDLGLKGLVECVLLLIEELLLCPLELLGFLASCSLLALCSLALLLCSSCHSRVSPQLLGLCIKCIACLEPQYVNLFNQPLHQLVYLSAVLVIHVR